MSFLSISDGTVVVSEDAGILPQVVALSGSDRSKQKTFFQEAITYVYYVYKRDGVYSDSFEHQRRAIVVKRHFPERTIEYFEENKYVKELIKEYLDRQMTKLERFYYMLEKDMESLLDQIAKIPYHKKAKALVPFQGPDGSDTKITAEIEIDNYDEKAKAMLMAEKLIDYSDKLKAKIIKEDMQKKRNPERRLYDK